MDCYKRDAIWEGKQRGTVNWWRLSSAASFSPNHLPPVRGQCGQGGNLVADGFTDSSGHHTLMCPPSAEKSLGCAGLWPELG